MFYDAILYKIRNLNNFKVYGHDETIDEALFRIVNHVLKEKDIKTIKDDLLIIDEKCFQDEKLLQLIDAYVIIGNIYRKEINKEEIKLEYKPKTPFMDDLENQSINDVRKKIKEYIKIDNDEIIDRSTFKLSINIQTLIQYITIITTMSFIGGYIYNKIFFSLHGLNITPFFTPTDYIFAAFEQIRSGLIGGGVYFGLTVPPISE